VHTVYVNSSCSDRDRRNRLYDGQIFVFSPSPATIAFRDFARQMIEEAFPGEDPRLVQYRIPVEEFVSIFAPLKPRFIHHPESRQLIRGIMQEKGFDLETTYIDVPRLRAVTSDGYLTSGVGYAHHLHRDTWYSAPQCQLNWWMPLYDLESEQSMAFHPRYWDEAVPNSSSDFNYYRWNSDGRKNAMQHIKTDTRVQPKPMFQIDIKPEVRVVCEPGGLILFSAAQMHSTVPNTSGSTRFSVDFRTVNIDDAAHLQGAPNLDSECTGTSLRDFVRGSDGAPVPVEVLNVYETTVPEGSALVFSPGGTV
jgi:hypothetical protein